jgi:hypothetical protein
MVIEDGGLDKVKRTGARTRPLRGRSEPPSVLDLMAAIAAGCQRSRLGTASDLQGSGARHCARTPPRPGAPGVSEERR